MSSDNQPYNPAQDLTSPSPSPSNNYNPLLFGLKGKDTNNRNFSLSPSDTVEINDSSSSISSYSSASSTTATEVVNNHESSLWGGDGKGKRGNREAQLMAAQVGQSVDTADSVFPRLPRKELEELEDFERFELDASRHVFEDFTRCSKSHLWKLMMSFYDSKGPGSWTGGVVPHFITSNTFIARAYIKTLLGFLDDCMHPTSPSMIIDPTEPLYIVEIGSGSGKMGFFMLKALDEMKAVCSFPIDNIVFVMTDFTESNLNFWLDHPALKPYFDSGRLDAAIFDAMKDNSMQLRHKGTTLSLGSVKNPICVVANYIFDTLCHDIFQVEGGQLKEGLISTGSKLLFESDPLEPAIIERLNNKFRYNAASTDYYDTRLDAIEGESGMESEAAVHRRLLKWYMNYFKSSDASFLLPVGALTVLRRLGLISNNRMIVLSGDKGYSDPEQFRGISDPHISIHGSFSMMVNYHAVGAYFTNKGGFSLQSSQDDASIKVACFVMLPPPNSNPFVHEDQDEEGKMKGKGKGRGEEEDDDDSLWVQARTLNDLNRSRSAEFPRLSHAFASEIERFGPNDYFVLQRTLKDEIASASLPSVLALLKLSDWDPDIFFKFRDEILSQTPSAGPRLRSDMCRGIPKIWDNYFMLDRDKDIAFEIGRFYYGLNDYKNALVYYERSVETVGPHHVTFHNQGLCLFSLGLKAKALLYFRRALNLSPGYDKARCWIEELSQPTAAVPTAPTTTNNNNNNNNNGSANASGGDI